jgi:hypothetical protein
MYIEVLIQSSANVRCSDLFGGGSFEALVVSFCGRGIF